GASCAVDVTFKPATVGAKSATLTITDNVGGAAQSIAVSGTSTATPPPPPAVTLTPASLTFADTLVGSVSVVKTVTVKNTGLGSLSVTALTLGGVDSANFAKGAQTCTGAPIAAGASCTVDLKFSPLATGTLGATLSIVDNVPGAPQTVTLGGTGTAPPAPVTPAPPAAPGGG